MSQNILRWHRIGFNYPMVNETKQIHKMNLDIVNTFTLLSIDFPDERSTKRSENSKQTFESEDIFSWICVKTNDEWSIQRHYKVNEGRYNIFLCLFFFSLSLGVQFPRLCLIRRLCFDDFLFFFFSQNFFFSLKYSQISDNISYQKNFFRVVSKDISLSPLCLRPLWFLISDFVWFLSRINIIFLLRIVS